MPASTLPRTVAVSIPDPEAGQCLPRSPLKIPEHSQASLAQSLLGHCSFLWVLVHTRFCLCPPRVSVSPVLWKFCNQVPLVFKVKFPWDPQSLCWIPRLVNLLWDPELLQQCENFFVIIVLQFVGCLLCSSIVELMATSSKRTYATHHICQICCSESLCPCGRSLLTCASTGDTQTLKPGLAQSLVQVPDPFPGSWCVQGFVCTL